LSTEGAKRIETKGTGDKDAIEAAEEPPPTVNAAPVDPTVTSNLNLADKVTRLYDVAPVVGIMLTDLTVVFAGKYVLFVSF
jgi:hypothetical protein